MSETLQLEQLTESLQQLLGESLFAIYLYGSAVDGGLGPESDLDVLVVVNQALTLHQRQQLAETLLKISYQLGLHSVHLKSPSYLRANSLRQLSTQLRTTIWGVVTGGVKPRCFAPRTYRP